MRRWLVAGLVLVLVGVSVALAQTTPAEITWVEFPRLEDGSYNACVPLALHGYTHGVNGETLPGCAASEWPDFIVERSALEALVAQRFAQRVGTTYLVPLSPPVDWSITCLHNAGYELPNVCTQSVVGGTPFPTATRDPNPRSDMLYACTRDPDQCQISIFHSPLGQRWLMRVCLPNENDFWNTWEIYGPMGDTYTFDADRNILGPMYYDIKNLNDGTEVLNGEFHFDTDPGFVIPDPNPDPNCGAKPAWSQ